MLPTSFLEWSDEASWNMKIQSYNCNHWHFLFYYVILYINLIHNQILKDDEAILCDSYTDRLNSSMAK